MSDPIRKPKGQLTDLDKQQMIEQYLNTKFPHEKEKLCRYYLRGCCMFQPGKYTQHPRGSHLPTPSMLGLTAAHPPAPLAI